MTIYNHLIGLQDRLGIIVPDDATLTRAERIGRILYTYGGVFIIFIIVGVYFGWINSPLFIAVKENQKLLLRHEIDQKELVTEFNTNVKFMREEIAKNKEALERLIRLLKIMDCGDIIDKTLRERCLAQ